MKTGERSRRDFIRSAAAITGIAAAGIAAETKSTNTLRIGIVGLGARGRELLNAFETIDDARIVALCDTDEGNLSDAQPKTQDNLSRYSAFERMLEAETLDALVVATPPASHLPMCTAAIDRGIPVYCESMMCHTLDDARRLAALANKQNAVVQIGLQRRANAVYEQAEAMIRSGMLGTVTSVKCHWHLNHNWRRPASPTRERDVNWRLYSPTAQGLMGELAIHQLDVMNRLLRCAPALVIATGGVDFWKDGRDACDNVYCTYTYEVPDAGEGKPQVVRASCSYVLTNAHEGASELFMGTKGTLLLSAKLGLFYSEGAQPIAAQSPPLDPALDGLSGASITSRDTPWAHRGRAMELRNTADDTRAALVAFVHAARAKDLQTICTAHTGLENAATSIIANESIQQGGTVRFPEDCRAIHA
ncbi:MAG TPA: Gfo/Idh/MocA family oxidoreductase [Candidatus Hydrogenedentes bacterium]|nr:Gfo/Idh/MocA family oxidoreductase [Candidatus Hydrogenedentota bacterium]HRK33503.1 Gfo/Idh/MocA family oxidoreductase [Candidatus Hydrogenedentota bacterium]